MISGDLKTSQVFLALGVTDMRKSINGLSLLVEEKFEQNIFSGSFFVFCNRRRDMVKILYWEKNGFCVWLKRLEEDFFLWPESEEEILEVTPRALGWLLSGLDFSSAHQEKGYKSVG